MHPRNLDPKPTTLPGAAPIAEDGAAELLEGGCSAGMPPPASRQGSRPARVSPSTSPLRPQRDDRLSAEPLLAAADGTVYVALDVVVEAVTGLAVSPEIPERVRRKGRRRWCYWCRCEEEFYSDRFDHQSRCGRCHAPPPRRIVYVSSVPGVEVGQFGEERSTLSTLDYLARHHPVTAAMEADQAGGRQETWRLWDLAELAAVHARPKRRGCTRKVGEAADWLEVQLADGPVPYGRLVHDAAVAAISATTLDRAKALLGVISGKLGGRGVGWAWRLPPGPDGKGPQSGSARVLVAGSVEACAEPPPGDPAPSGASRGEGFVCPGTEASASTAGGCSARR